MLLAATPGTVVRPVLQNASIIGGENDERVRGETGAVQRIEHPANAGIKVLD